MINGTCGDSAIGHLCELEGNRLHPSTKNHLGATWFKLIATMAGKSKLVNKKSKKKQNTHGSFWAEHTWFFLSRTHMVWYFAICEITAFFKCDLQLFLSIQWKILTAWMKKSISIHLKCFYMFCSLALIPQQEISMFWQHLKFELLCATLYL